MKKYKKYAPVGLIIGLIGAIASLVLRIAFGQFTLSVQISILVSVLGLAGFIILDPETILSFFKGRQAKYGSNALILTLAVIAILVILNLFIYNNDVTWDLTEDKENTLAPETIEVLNNMSVPITARAFYTSTNSGQTNAEKLLSNFANESGGTFDYEFIDPMADPVATTQAGIDRDGTIILTAREQQEEVAFASEQNLLNAVIKLQNPTSPIIYTLTGHGELDFFTSGDYALTQVLDTLQRKNYQIETLNLLSTPEIPTDAKAIVIPGPQLALDQSEVDLIAAYLEQGGSLVIFYDPNFLTDIDPSADPLADYLFSNWGAVFGDDLIIDLSIDPAEIAVADQYGEHPITEEVMGYVTFYPTSRSITLTPIETINATNLVLTSNRSWAETNIEGVLNNEAGFDDNDTQGPISLAVALENPTSGARVVLVGDSDFATDAFVTAYGNLDFSAGIIDWVAENESLIQITPKQTTSRILIPPTRATRLAIIIGGLLGIPLFIAATGIIIAIQRKRNK